MPFQTELWEIAAASLHTKTYRENYSQAITHAIQNTSVAILDTACGTGFPTIDLYEHGYQNITCADGDAKSVERLSKFFKEKQYPIPIIETLWQDLGRATDQLFDVVLNVDNSLVYLDGWLKNSTNDPEEARKRIVQVLKNFHTRLNHEGKIIIGSCDTYPETVTERTYLKKEFDYKGAHIVTHWHCRYDWTHRLREWTVYVKKDGQDMEQTVQSYIVTQQEMVEIFKQAGFDGIEVIDIRDHEIYDFLFTGRKI